MTRAYDEVYLEDAMNTLGSMYDYAVYEANFSLKEIHTMFLQSGIAEQFGKGNPKYIAGMSGAELARSVIGKIYGYDYLLPIAMAPLDRSEEYWTGWILCYYQWYTGKTFARIEEDGLMIDVICSLYPVLHEAGLEKFVEVADKRIEDHLNANPSKLQQMRKKRKMTQKELAEKSGVALRCVQLYEQKQQDIARAEVRNILSLASALRCDVTDII